MTYADDFDSLISIERTRIDNFYAYIYVKIRSPKAHTTHKSYRMWIEDMETEVVELLDKNVYYIDRNERADGTEYDYDTQIEIKRNKELVFKLYLSTQHVEGNRFYKRFRLRLKNNEYCSNTDTDAWISDEMILASREFGMPDVECKSLAVLNEPEEDAGKLYAKVSATFPTAKDEVDYNSFLKMYITVYNKERLVGEEELDALEKDTTWQTYYFKTEKKYDTAITRIKITNKFLNGEIASEKTFHLENINEQKFFVAYDMNIERATAVVVRDEQGTLGTIKEIYVKS